MNRKLITLGGFGLAIALSACAPKPTIIYAEPVFDKYGNPDCRPGDVPVGGAYTADLPICPILSESTGYAGTTSTGTTTGTATDATDGTVPADPVVPDPVDPEDPVVDENGRNQNQVQAGQGQDGQGGQGQGGQGQGGN